MSKNVFFDCFLVAGFRLAVDRGIGNTVRQSTDWLDPIHGASTGLGQVRGRFPRGAADGGCVPPSLATPRSPDTFEGRSVHQTESHSFHAKASVKGQLQWRNHCFSLGTPWSVCRFSPCWLMDWIIQFVHFSASRRCLISVSRLH